MFPAPTQNFFCFRLPPLSRQLQASAVVLLKCRAEQVQLNLPKPDNSDMAAGTCTHYFGRLCLIHAAMPVRCWKPHHISSHAWQTSQAQRLHADGAPMLLNTLLLLRWSQCARSLPASSRHAPCMRPNGLPGLALQHVTQESPLNVPVSDLDGKRVPLQTKQLLPSGAVQVYVSKCCRHLSRAIGKKIVMPQKLRKVLKHRC